MLCEGFAYQWLDLLIAIMSVIYDAFLPYVYSVFLQLQHHEGARLLYTNGHLGLVLFSSQCDASIRTVKHLLDWRMVNATSKCVSIVARF